MPAALKVRALKEAKMRITLALLTMAAISFLAAGCGGGPMKYQTYGRILKDGAPFLPPKDDAVRVTLVPIPETGGKVMNWYAARYNAKDASFRASGPDGAGIPPGKYRVCVELLHNRNDVFKGAYFGETSPFVREVRSRSDEITIDLAKKE
jgi:hypothetical protein